MRKSMFLTNKEISELTGYVRPAAQQRWLDLNGFAYVINVHGKPKVLRRLVYSKLGHVAQVEIKEEPNFAALFR